MSHPDYEQQAHHHSCLLVLIRGIGPSKPRSLQKIFERIQHVNNVKIKGINGHSASPLLSTKFNMFIYFFSYQFHFMLTYRLSRVPERYLGAICTRLSGRE